MMIIYLFLVLLSSCIDSGMEPIPNKTPMENEMQYSGDYLALGDSYTIGESVAEAERWPNVLHDSLTSMGFEFNRPQIIARTGWRTDELLQSARSGATRNDYSLVSLLIGVNNQYQGRSVDSYRPEFEELIEFAIGKAGGDPTRVFVLSIPDYGCTPFGESNAEKIALEIDAYNAVNKEIAESYGIAYFDITPASRLAKEDPTLVANDGLHPSGKQYNLWVQEVLKNTEFLNRFID